jgi:hypothetical protein
MSHGSERWRSPAGLGLELSSRPVWRAAPMGLDQPVQSIMTAPVRASSACLPCASQHEDPSRILLPRALRPCPAGQVTSLLSYTTFSRLGEKPSLTSFPPHKGERPSLPPPYRGKKQRLTPENALPGVPPQASYLDSF